MPSPQRRRPRHIDLPFLRQLDQRIGRTAVNDSHAVLPLGSFRRHVAFDDIPKNFVRRALERIAVTASARQIYMNDFVLWSNP